MPQIGWLYKGKRYSFEELEQFAESYPPGFPFTPGQVQDMRQGKERDYISPTTLGGCARQWMLKRNLDYYSDIEKSWAKFRGTRIHALMEGEYQEPDAIIEQRRRKTIMTEAGPVMIEGTPDKVVPSKKLLIDYKSIQDVITPDVLTGPITKAAQAQGKVAGWTCQLSCYRWMLYPDIPIERAFIQQISMKAPFRLEIQLWDLERTEAWIRARVPEFVQALEGNMDEGLPRILIEGIDKNFFLCRSWCPVAEPCRRLLLEGK